MAAKKPKLAELPGGFDAEIVLSDVDVARLLRVETSTIEGLVRDDKLVAIKVGRYRRFTPSAVRNYVTSLES